jgi:hypothetical protein
VTQFAYMIGEASGPALGGLAIDLAPRLGLPALVAGAGLGVLLVLLRCTRQGAPAAPALSHSA